MILKKLLKWYLNKRRKSLKKFPINQQSQFNFATNQT